MDCFFCGRTIEVRERVGFRDECPGCGRAQHACRNCTFFDPAYHNQCREPMAERVVDKDRANFCEYFSPRTARTATHAQSAGRKDLEALFRKR